MPQRDFLPMNWAAFAVWIANFVVQLGTLKTKYGVSNDKVDALLLDNTWVQFWADGRSKTKQQKKQVTDYSDAVRTGNLGAPAESNPVWNLGMMPASVPTGVNARIREVANFIKAQKSVYTVADGELLGIVTPEEAGKAEEDYQPDVKLTSEPNYNLEADFRLFGLDALRVEFRHKGGEWQTAATLTSSPGAFHINPTTPGNAEQIEIRAVFIEKNQPYGQYSPIYSVVIQP